MYVKGCKRERESERQQKDGVFVFTSYFHAVSTIDVFYIFLQDNDASYCGTLQAVGRDGKWVICNNSNVT